MNKKYVTCILSAILCTLALFSLRELPAKAESDFGYKEQVFTADDGLLTTATLTVGQTKDGFIWFGGYGGLTRYDGNEFVSYGGSKVSNVAALLGTEDGTLWISSLDSGLIRYRDNDFLFLSELGLEKAPEDVNDLAVAKDGAVYFAAANGLGYVDENDRLFWIEDPQIADQSIISVACGKDGAIWCLTEEGNVYICERGVRKLDISVENDVIRCLDYDSASKQFYLGSEANQVFIFGEDGKQEKRLRVDGVNCINAFAFTKDGEAYIGSDDGVAVISGGTVTIQQQKIENSIEDILVDKDDNLWFASSRQGTLLVTTGRFRDISLLAGLDPCIVNTILYEGDRLYIGHDRGFMILNEKTYEKIEDPDYDILQGMRIRQMYLDKKGRMWVCTTGNGLYLRNEDMTWKHYSTVEYKALQSDKFRGIIETPNAMVAATDAGAYSISGDDVQLLASGLTMRILSLIEVDGVIYAGTDGQGVYTIENGSVTGQITTENGLSSMRVMKMVPCSGGRGLWMASGNNLDYLLFETGEVYYAKTFPAANVMDCMVMDDGTLWVLAGNGIYQTTEDTILKDETARNYRHYSKKNGIPYDLTANSYSVIVGDHAYLCGSDGVTWMNIETEYGIPDEYSIILDEMKMDEESVYIQNQDKVKIESRIHRLEISAHMATYSQENPTMFYFMEGFDDNYHYVPFQKLSPIVYTNIPGGKYIFHFGVYDPSTGDIGQEKTLRLHVQYEWHERTYVRVLLFLAGAMLLLAGAWIVFNARTKREKKKLESMYFEKEQKLLMKRAYTDYLTELYNRNYLSRFDESHLAERKFPICFIVLDCNDLKLINDTYGHDRGDELLKKLAELLREHFPKGDNTVLRLGGDEFLVIAEGLSEGAAQIQMAHLTRVAGNARVEKIPITFCYGISVCEGPETYDLGRLTQIADEQMIKCKQLYHSQIYASEMPQETDDASRGNRTERHLKSDVLNNILYEAFAEASDNVYIYALDMATGVSRWSRNCVNFFGLPAEYMVDADRIWESHVHPDDRGTYLEDIGPVFMGKKTRHACQYRVKNCFDEYVWVECKGTVIRSANGKDIFAGMITRLDNQSIYDPLTGLKTKNQFYDVLEEAEQGSVMMIGIDDFKDVISAYGYKNADKILVQMGRSLSRWDSDVCKVFRLVGAEFVFFLTSENPTDLRRIFSGLREEMSSLTLENGIRLNLSFTGGATIFRKSMDTTDSIVNKVELALEHAKEKQKGELGFYSENITAIFKRRNLIKKLMRESIGDGFRGFELYYQPLMRRDGKQIIGCEALIRFRHERMQDTCPAEFVPILEDTGDIIEVGRFVMREAMRQQKIWHEKFGRFLMSVNVSYQQFLVDGYVEETVQMAKELDVDPTCIIIELTESAKVQAPETLADIFMQLRSHGFNVVMDDFGTGYSSLEMLKKLPANGVKIDNNFVRELGKKGNDIDLAIIRAILTLCEKLGLHVIIEGVENEEVDMIIRNMTIGYLQGFHYSKPVCGKEFEELLRKKLQK